MLNLLGITKAWENVDHFSPEKQILHVSTVEKKDRENIWLYMVIRKGFDGLTLEDLVNSVNYS